MTNTVSRDGNMLLNIGPDPQGNVPPDQVARLLEVGDWLKTYGKAIYATRGGPFLPTPQVTSTRRDNLVYVHILPDESGGLPRVVNIPRLSPALELKSARLLATGTQVSSRRAGGVIEVNVPDRINGSPTQVIELAYGGSVMDLVPMHLP